MGVVEEVAADCTMHSCLVVSALCLNDDAEGWFISLISLLTERGEDDDDGSAAAVASDLLSTRVLLCCM